MRFMQLTATQTEAEFSGDVPERFAMLFVALHIHINAIGNGLLVVLFNFGLITTQIQPRFWQVFNIAAIGKICACRAQKAIMDILVVISRNVINFARLIGCWYPL